VCKAALETSCCTEIPYRFSALLHHIPYFNFEVRYVKSVRLFLMLSLVFLPGFAAHAQNGFYSSMISGQCKADGTSRNISYDQSVGVSASPKQNIVAGFAWTSINAYDKVGVTVVLNNQAATIQAAIVATNGGSLSLTTATGGTTLETSPYTITYSIVPDGTGNPYQTIKNLFSGLYLSAGTYTVMLYSPTNTFQWQSTNGSEVPTPDGTGGITSGGALNLAAGAPLPNPSANPVATPWQNSVLLGRDTGIGAICFDVHGILLQPQTITLNLTSATWIWNLSPKTFTLKATTTSGGPITYSVGQASGTKPIASVNGDLLTLTGVAGKFTVTATQAGTDMYLPVSVTVSETVDVLHAVQPPH